MRFYTRRTEYIYLVLFLCLPFQTHADREQYIETVEVTASAITSAGGNIDAETYYDAEQIEALGASTLEELMEELAPDVASAQGRHAGKPIVLLNGRRIASFQEIRAYPPEAIKSLEIFPEEVALRHGYRANQKVVNIELLPQFEATTAKGGAQVSARNGGEAMNVSGDYLRLQLDQRLSFNLKIVDQNEILESDRTVPSRSQGIPFSLAGNLRSPGGGELDSALSALAGTTVTATTLPDNTDTVPLTLDSLLPLANNPDRSDVQDYRSLRPKRQTYSSGVSYSRPLGDRLLATLSAGYDQTEEISYLGLPGYTQFIGRNNPFSPFNTTVELNRLSQFSGPLQRNYTSDIYTLNANFAATFNNWTWSWITNVAQTERKTRTDRRLTVDSLPTGTNPFSNLDDSLQLQTDEQNSEARDYDTSFLANGTLGELPHGPIATTLFGGFTRNEQRNTTSNNTGDAINRLTRNLAQVRASVNLPLLNSDKTGELFADLNAEASHYSDFDQIIALGAGLNWKPNDTLRFLLLYSLEEGAPSIAELGDPLVQTPNLSVYDFVNDESVRVTRVSGGNPGLKPDKREIWRLNARLQPFADHDLGFNINWIGSNTKRPIDIFPSPSQEIENAFPQRFLRDTNGELFEFDTRPINLHSERTNEVRWGLRYTRPLSKTPRSPSARNSSSYNKRGNRSGRNGRMLFALNHIWTLKDDLVIAPGQEAIDYIGRSTNGRRRGGAEHTLTARMSYYQKGRGFRLDAKWQDAISSLADPDGSVDLRQSPLYTVNVTAFYLFTPKSRPVKRFNWLKGLRVRMDVKNVFNEKPRIRALNGVIPAGSSGDELDPFGRTFIIELRKMIK